MCQKSDSQKVCAIVAMDENRVIGFENRLPWDIPEDLKRFSKLTTGGTVLMGRKTYESLPEQYRPLPKRENIIATRDPESFSKKYSGAAAISDIEGFVSEVKSGNRLVKGGVLWVIGGEQIYRGTQSLWDRVELTLVKGEHQGDTYFPEFESEYQLAEAKESETHSFLSYERKI